MSFQVFATGTVDTDSPQMPPEFTIYEFNDISTYEIDPSGVLLVDDNGDSNMLIFAPGQWRWVKTDGHLPGEISRDITD